MSSVAKTNTARILDQLGINYELRSYEVSEVHQSAEDVAEAIGVSPEKIYKTLVLRSFKDAFIVCVIPANAQLDLKKAAAASGSKSCEMLPMKDLLSITGYVRGGCSPIGMKKPYPTYIEEIATLEEYIIVSAGKKGTQIVLKPSDLRSVTLGSFEDLITF